MPRIAYIPRRFTDTSSRVIHLANQILEEYEQQGYDLTLRQLYYQFVARGYIPNSDREYKKLGSIVNDARLAGRIDWDHIVDRTRFLRPVSTWGSPAAIIRGAARGYQRDLWADQAKRVEVWIEKDALVGVIERACADLRVPFLSCRGYTSQSEMWGASQRFWNYTTEVGASGQGKGVVVFHLGDHDPSGIDMSRDIEERILHFIASDYYRTQCFEDDDDERDSSDEAREAMAERAVGWAAERFELRRLALNWDQVQQYQPPPNPAKMTDARARGYVKEFGNESWELDALDPTVIGDLIAEAVIGERDDDLWEAAREQETEERDGLMTASDRWADVVAYLGNGNGHAK